MDRRSMSPNCGSNPDDVFLFADDAAPMPACFNNPSTYEPTEPEPVEPRPLPNAGPLHPTPPSLPIAGPDFNDSYGPRTQSRGRYSHLWQDRLTPRNASVRGPRRTGPALNPHLIEMLRAGRRSPRAEPGSGGSGSGAGPRDSFPGPLQPRHILLGERPPWRNNNNDNNNNDNDNDNDHDDEAKPARRTSPPPPYTPLNRIPAPQLQQQQQQQQNRQDRLPFFGPLNETSRHQGINPLNFSMLLSSPSPPPLPPRRPETPTPPDASGGQPHPRQSPPTLAPLRRGEEDSDEWSGTTAVGSDWSWERLRGGQETLDLGSRAGGDAGVGLELQGSAPRVIRSRWPSPASFRASSPNPNPNPSPDPRAEGESGDNDGPRAGGGGDESQGPDATTDRAQTAPSEQEQGQEQEQEQEQEQRDVGTDPIVHDDLGPADGENRGTPEHNGTVVEQPEDRAGSPGPAENVVGETRIWIEGDVHIELSSAEGFERCLRAMPSLTIQGNVYIRTAGQKRKRDDDGSETDDDDDESSEDEEDTDGYEGSSEDSEAGHRSPKRR